MRPARGKSAATVSKSKACVVRIEKFAQSRDESEDDRKKMTGPLKKRPVVLKKQPAGVSKTRRRAVEEDLSEYMLVTARARRTPKPNPKYSNDDVVSPWNKNKEEIESDSDEQIAYQSSDPEEVPEDESEEEFEPKVATRNASRVNDPGDIIKRGVGRPGKIKIDEKPSPKAAQKRRYQIDNESKALESLLAQNKRLNIEVYDATDSDSSMVSPGRIGARGGLRQSRLSLKPQKQEPKKFPVRRRIRGRPRKATSDEDDFDPDDFEATTGAASTIDDFETMPTFTIVNINDIINKKGDVLIQKTSQRTSGGSTGGGGMGGSGRSESNNKSSDRDDDSGISPSQSSRNRRKTMHTTILSDKIDPDKLKTPPPRTPFPPRNLVVPNYHTFRSNNNNLSKSLLNNNRLYKTAPRILNSVLARKNKAVQAQQEQQQQRQQAQIQKAELQQSEEPELRHKVQSKENHQLNNIRAGSITTAAAATPTATSAAATTAVNRKLPSEKVLIQRQGNKIIKKITCFETWYVINIPPVENYTPKLHFGMSLMRLGNTLQDVRLPSSDWNYKITLQKLTAIQMTKLDEIYTGEVQDSNIEPSEKFKYHPINVMFRRTSQNDKLRMPYDRAVIFKNKTYFTNIDGKNVRLVGAPHAINSLTDVEILLQIVDEMTLVSPFVEQTAYIL